MLLLLPEAFEVLFCDVMGVDIGSIGYPCGVGSCSRQPVWVEMRGVRGRLRRVAVLNLQR